MELKMEFLMFIVCVTSPIVESITISSNGNSPTTKMLGGMVVDVQQGFVPMTPKSELSTVSSNYEKSRKLNINSTKLALNERYRRLIPYMTFYYANDLFGPTTENSRNIEVEKAHIIEAQEIANQREAKKIFSQRNIPRYQGNRLTQYNIASANPTKIFYKNGVPIYQIQPSKGVTLNYNPQLPDFSEYHNDGRIGQQKVQPPAIAITTRKPFLNLYNEESPNIRYYLSEKEQSPKYKLVPYEQTSPFFPFEQSPVNIPFEREPKDKIRVSYEQAAPVKVPVKVLYNQAPLKLSYEDAPVKLQYEQKKPQNENVYATRKPVIMSVLVPKELYVKPRPVRPPVIYDNSAKQPVRKQPAIVTDSYYEKQRPQNIVTEPVIEGGFKPIINPVVYTTEPSILTSSFTVKTTAVPSYVDSSSVTHTSDGRPFYQYVDQPKPGPTKPTAPVSIASLLNSLQINKSIPKPLTRDNVASSIKTLLQVLNSLKAAQTPNNVELFPISTPRPFAASKVKDSPIVAQLRPEIADDGLEKELHLAPVPTPSQHLDEERLIDHPSGIAGISHRFPLPVSSDDEGGTPGHPGVDYPVLSTIPQTSFDCKAQRYKGFFADTETRCQVWHYCDLNGGQASFLCPNGTVFSQAGLTCDWWFNVRCNSTTQLYVLNESLYKFILPQMPKFPEDYSGPLVDKYLMLKFKEMEEEFKKNKNKHIEDKSDVEEDSSETISFEDVPSSSSDEMDKRQLGALSQSSVIIESPGSSGKVERLQDE